MGARCLRPDEPVAIDCTPRGSCQVIGNQGTTALYWLRSPADLTRAMRKLVADGEMVRVGRGVDLV